MMERYTFETEKEFVMWLNKQGFGEDYINNIIKHESAHFNKSKSNGYNAIYVMERQAGGYNFGWNPSVEVRGNINFKDALAIGMAPKNPGRADIKNVILSFGGKLI